MKLKLVRNSNKINLIIKYKALKNIKIIIFYKIKHKLYKLK